MKGQYLLIVLVYKSCTVENSTLASVGCHLTIVFSKFINFAHKCYIGILTIINHPLDVKMMDIIITV